MIGISIAIITNDLLDQVGYCCTDSGVNRGSDPSFVRGCQRVAWTSLACHCQLTFRSIRPRTSPLSPSGIIPTFSKRASIHSKEGRRSFVALPSSPDQMANSSSGDSKKRFSESAHDQLPKAVTRNQAAVGQKRPLGRDEVPASTSRRRRLSRCEVGSSSRFPRPDGLVLVPEVNSCDPSDIAVDTIDSDLSNRQLERALADLRRVEKKLEHEEQMRRQTEIKIKQDMYLDMLKSQEKARRDIELLERHRYRAQQKIEMQVSMLIHRLHIGNVCANPLSLSV